MPKVLHGRKLTAHEHEIWKSAYESAKRNPKVRNPGAVATAAVLDSRRRKRGK